MYRNNEKLWGKLMMSMNLMVAIKVELVAISLFDSGHTAKYEIYHYIWILVFHYLERKVSRSNIPLGIGNGDHEGAKIRR